MRIFLKLVLIFYSSLSFAVCDFKKDVKKVVSLSGSTTVILKEFGLLKNPKLHGISVFNPINENEFKGTIYPGGIFLSQGSLTELDGAVVLYDESRDLKKILGTHEKIVSREVKTRNQTPGETIESNVMLLSEFISGCEKEISSLKNKTKSIEDKILAKLPSPFSVIFYLGDFANGRLPEMVMVNDGAVKWLIQKEKIQTYPTELAYVNWSAKIMQTFSGKTLHVGIKDSGRTSEKKILRSSQKMTLIYPGSLVPGLSQLEGFLYWSENL
jgi:hypothetical protein